MEKKTKAIISTIAVLTMTIGMSTVSLAESGIKSNGVIDFGNGIVFDASDFDTLETAIETGKESAYNSGYNAGSTAGYSEGYSVGYSEGYASKTVDADIIYKYHHHTADGTDTTVTFTQEEVQNGTKDAWFTENAVAEYNATSSGCYTKYTTATESYVDHYEQGMEYLQPGEWVQTDETGAMHWSGEIRYYTYPVYGTRTVEKGYAPDCGYAEGDLISIEVKVK